MIYGPGQYRRIVTLRMSQIPGVELVLLCEYCLWSIEIRKVEVAIRKISMTKQSD